MNIFDKIYKWATLQRCPATTVYARNCVGIIHEDLVGYVVHVCRVYMGDEVYASKRFFRFESARTFAVSMSKAISDLRDGNDVSPISKELVVTCYRLRFYQKIRTLLFPLTTKFSY